MLTRVFLAAGVAALAIAAPGYAEKGGHGGGGGHGNGGGGGAPASVNAGGGGGGGGHGHGGGGGGGGGGAAPAFAGGGGEGHGHGHGGGGGGFAPMFAGGGGHGHGHGGGGGGGFQPQAFAGGGGGHGHGHGGGGGQRQTVMSGGGGHGHGRGGGFAAPQMRAERQQGHQQARGFERQQARNVQHQQMRGFERQQARTAQGEQVRGNGAKAFANQPEFRGNGAKAFANERFNGQLTAQEFGGARMNGKEARFANREFVQANWNPDRLSVLSLGDNGRVLPVTQVASFVGEPIAAVPAFVTLSAVPATIQYLYPDTPDYYYRYGSGYLYQVDRTDSLIAALIPLLAGGYLPGQYLPSAYMQSFAPAYYGFDAFYPADYGYGNLCNRYYYGVVYQVDCFNGMVENVIPMYAGGYGVGQLLPSAYSYYNVPLQYRGLYYNTADAGYWYSPGAIYQYDPRSSVITSVAALMAPGFTIGQPLPVGYDVYNVPYDYRATYYDTPTAWYRYNNGYIYQVDPVTQLVTAIVASLLT